jgi:hypothetical protein
MVICSDKVDGDAFTTESAATSNPANKQS